MCNSGVQTESCAGMRQLSLILAIAFIAITPLVAQSPTHRAAGFVLAQNPSAVDFTVHDQTGRLYRLSDHRGHPVLLMFYRGYWCPFCMAELREVARHYPEFKNLDVEVVALGVDDQQHAQLVWKDAALRRFTVLSDTGASVVRDFKLVQIQGGPTGQDIPIRTAVLIGADGKERWRLVSESMDDPPTVQELLNQIRKTH